jgi:hypothetical protein
MQSFLNFSPTAIQEGLEEFVYSWNTPDIKSDGEIVLVGILELNEDEQRRLDEVKKLSADGITLDSSQQEDFYALQLKRGTKASIKIAIQKIDSYSQPNPKVEVTLRGEINKEQFKKFINWGWKINHSTFKYVCSQEEIFDKNSNIARLISVAIKCIDQYKWKTP